MRRSVMNGPMVAVLFTASYLGVAGAANAAGYNETDLVIGGPCDPNNPPACKDKNINFNTKPPTLTDAVNNIKHQAPFDQNLQNPWGIAASGTSPFWISDNAIGKETLYNSAGAKNPLVVNVPAPGGGLGAPTGNVFNTTTLTNQPGFNISGVTSSDCKSAITAPARFMFATEDGTIVGWAPSVFPPNHCTVGATQSTNGIIVVDNSQATHKTPGAVYKGLAIATAEDGETFLFATNFRAGWVEKYDSTFSLLDTFTDKKVPDGYAPFNIVPITIGGETELVVTFAVQDTAKHDDVAGAGNGIVDIFPLEGTNRRGQQKKADRLAAGGVLNSPWGVALAPSDFGVLSDALLIGNFGDGKINAFDPDSGDFLGTLNKSDGNTFVVDSLWAIKFGADSMNEGPHNTLFFTAGVNGETDGLFGKLTPSP